MASILHSMKIKLFPILLLLLFLGCEPAHPPQPSQASDPKSAQLLEKEPIPTNMKEVRNAIGYPLKADEAKSKGTVKLRILVDEQGQYVRHMVLEQGHPVFLRAVISHVSKLRFEPALEKGQPVIRWVTIPFPY
jgi:TonB family protein